MLSAIGVYSSSMEFIETPTFTRQVQELLSDEEYRGLQNTLAENPESGDLIKAGGGIRKVRHAVQGRGKSGGVRAIYSRTGTRSTCWSSTRSPRRTT